MNTNLIKDTVFKTVDFSYDGEIEFGEFDGVKVEFDGKSAKLSGNTKPQLARACFLFAMNVSEGKKNFTIEEKPRFDTLGVMVDCSRNAVLTVEATKKYIDTIVALGMNMLMLYTEDTFEVDGRPRFGYMRGKYTTEELQEIDAYADSMGVELIPCIQTLAHLMQYLKWSIENAIDEGNEKIGKIVDTSEVILCDEEETYRFIEDEIKACRKAYKTNKIHIGFDEAAGIGMGQYFKKHGLQNHFEIMLRHLDKVAEISRRYGFEPMMWSDMFFRLKTGTYYTYNFDFEKEIGERIPNVPQVYWDYYHDDELFYDEMFKKHRQLGQKIVFAGGITGRSYLTFHLYAYQNCLAAAKSALKNEIRDVLVTIWGDGGNERNITFSTPYLPIYSEYFYKGENCTEDEIKKVSEFLTKKKFSDVEIMGQSADKKGEIFRHGLGGRLFYCDILYDLSINLDSCDEIIENYTKYSQRLQVLENMKDKNYDDYHLVRLYYDILVLKATLRRDLRASYKNGNRTFLEKAVNQIIPALQTTYKEFLKTFKRMWVNSYKRFGLEVISFRIGGIICRLNDAREIISDYLSGECSNIEELDQTLLLNREEALDIELMVSPSRKF